MSSSVLLAGELAFDHHITSVVCEPAKNVAYVGLWNGAVASVDVASLSPIYMEKVTDSPTLCVLPFNDRVYTGHYDGSIYDHSGQAVLREHEGGIVGLARADNMLFSASYDKTVKCIDPRINQSTNTITLDNEGRCLSASGTSLVVGCSLSTTLLYDTRKMAQPLSSSTKLENQVRCVAVSSKSRDYLAGSVGGRVRVEQTPDSSSFKFKVQTGGVLYPINSILFHSSGFFMTGTSCGDITSWDYVKRVRLLQVIPGTANPGTQLSVVKCVTAMDFCSEDEQTLVVADSYDFSRGPDYETGEHKLKKINLPSKTWHRANS